MKEINYLILFIIAVSIALVNPVDAVCIDNKVTVCTNIQDAIVTIQTPDLDKSKLLKVDEIWDIGKGYTLTAQKIDVKGTTATFVLSRNGSLVDTKVVSVKSYYKYNNIFSAYIDCVFVGLTTNLTKLENIKFLSEPYYWWKTSSGTTSAKSENQWYWESNFINFNEEETWKVFYGNIDGYLKPENETQTAADRNCIEFTGVYRGGDIIITSNIAEASFTISGPGDYIKSGSETLWNDYNVKGGSYTVDFLDISGYSVTADQTKTVTPGSVVYFSATYTPLPIPSTLTSTPSTPIPTIPTLIPSTPIPTIPTPTPSTPMPTTPTPTPTAYPGGEGATQTPQIPDGNIDTNVIVALIGALATIIVGYLGYRAAKKK